MYLIVWLQRIMKVDLQLIEQSTLDIMGEEDEEQQNEEQENNREESRVLQNWGWFAIWGITGRINFIYFDVLLILFIFYFCYFLALFVVPLKRSIFSKSIINGRNSLNLTVNSDPAPEMYISCHVFNF